MDELVDGRRDYKAEIKRQRRMARKMAEVEVSFLRQESIYIEKQKLAFTRNFALSGLFITCHPDTGQKPQSLPTDTQTAQRFTLNSTSSYHSPGITLYADKHSNRTPLHTKFHIGIISLSRYHSLCRQVDEAINSCHPDTGQKSQSLPTNTQTANRFTPHSTLASYHTPDISRQNHSRYLHSNRTPLHTTFHIGIISFSRYHSLCRQLDDATVSCHPGTGQKSQSLPTNTQTTHRFTPHSTLASYHTPDISRQNHSRYLHSNRTPLHTTFHIGIISYSRYL
ncbi:hypothetical protein J6590_086202 [Homalodisca vitripennis]|nr:hypothetical protein J6590_086202 [Homalodisca vitripennis]